MSEHDETLPDELLGELLAPLREVTVPDEVRAANRAAISRALARNSRPEWWRRTVAVPVPIAIAATLAIVAATVALLMSSSGPQRAESMVSQPTQNQVAATSIERSVVVGGSRPANWSVARSYLQSIQSFAAGQVSADFDTKEKRNDS